MAPVAGEGAPQQPERLAGCHPAAGLVGEGNDPVHVREFGERIQSQDLMTLECVGDQSGNMRAAVHGRQDTDVVARRDAAVRAAYALEGRPRLDHLRGPGVHPERIVL